MLIISLVHNCQPHPKSTSFCSNYSKLAVVLRSGTNKAVRHVSITYCHIAMQTVRMYACMHVCLCVRMLGIRLIYEDQTLLKCWLLDWMLKYGSAKHMADEILFGFTVILCKVLLLAANSNIWANIGNQLSLVFQIQYVFTLDQCLLCVMVYVRQCFVLPPILVQMLVFCILFIWEIWFVWSWRSINKHQ